MAMKRQDRDRWVAALRSGDYEQCTGKLHDGDMGFCCLGVAANLFSKEPWRAPRFEGGNWRILDNTSTYWPTGMPHSQVDHVIGMNDMGWTFDQIADWIEKNVEIEP